MYSRLSERKLVPRRGCFALWVKRRGVATLAGNFRREPLELLACRPVLPDVQKLRQRPGKLGGRADDEPPLLGIPFLLAADDDAGPADDPPAEFPRNRRRRAARNVGEREHLARRSRGKRLKGGQ